MKKASSGEIPTFPDWLPNSVRNKALDLFAQANKEGDVELAELVTRMATDKRMKHVWLELTSRDRSSGKFQHKVRDSIETDYFPKQSGFEDRSTWLQETYLAMIFQQSIKFAALAMPSVEARRKQVWRERAILLQTDSERVLETYNQRPPSRLQSDWADALNKAAIAYLEMAEDQDARRSNRVNATVFSLWLAGRFRNALGKSLHGTVAKWASVALDRDITQSSVREWCRGPWGTEPKKSKRNL